MKFMIAALAALALALPLGAQNVAHADYACKGTAKDCARYEKGAYKKTTSKNSYASNKSSRAYSGTTSGRTYQTGIASYYWQPQKVASGGYFNPNALTAAHKTLPFGTRVKVTHLGNGRSVIVKINDRGPYIKGRIIDLSKRAAGVIGMQGSGIARVKIEILGRS